VETRPRVSSVTGDEWQQEAVAVDEELNKGNEERRKAEILCKLALAKAEEAINIRKFSSWIKLIRITALIRRLASKVRARREERRENNQSLDMKSLLAPQELKEAELFWIQEAQKSLKDRVAKGEFKSLSPFKPTKNLRERFEFVQKLVDSFWKRWSRDVYPSLVLRKKWQVERRNVQVNDVVTYIDDNAIRGKWMLGRIVEVYPGQDGRIRNVRVKTSVGQYIRPVTKIAVIYPTEGYNEEE
jgi:hypothetical protein